MLPEGSISATDIWKRFRADRTRMLLRDELERLGNRVLGRPGGGWRWALRDVNCLVEPGESLALVGANGSGKSTLLKILTRVMYPHTGRVTVSGRVGALIEVRAGIHPDLTGRENAFLYGSLLGLPRRQVARRFDEIVAFAELEDSVDRQVKHYSSGMQMRLGFAVAAFLEPHVLLVDEVLAVGDAAFQQKCLDRMRAVLAQGTTLVFVSHDLPAVEATCTRGIWLDRGLVRADGPIRDVLGRYRRSIEESVAAAPDASGPVRLLKARVEGTDGCRPASNQPLDVSLVFGTDAVQPAVVYLGVSEGTATPVFVLRRDVVLPGGDAEVRCRVSDLPLPRGRFYLWVAVFDTHKSTTLDLLPWHPATQFDVDGPDLDVTPQGVVRVAPVQVRAGWDVSEVRPLSSVSATVLRANGSELP